MGVQPTGNQLDVLWFSSARSSRVTRSSTSIRSRDVLSMLKDLEVIEVPQPVDPYK